MKRFNVMNLICAFSAILITELSSALIIQSHNQQIQINEEDIPELVCPKVSGPIADSCRCLLASLECGCRETSRPVDEPRHPTPEDGLAWTDVLLVRK